MTESTDLIRRLETAISTKSLHPEYARGLLREAKDALQVDAECEPWPERRALYRATALGLGATHLLPPHLQDIGDEPT